MRRLLVAFAPLALVAACATPPQQQAGWTPPALDGMGGSAYGAFLAGQGALNDGKGAEAAAYFAKAELEGGSSDMLQDRAFTAAVLAGDIPRAAQLAPQGEEASEFHSHFMTTLSKNSPGDKDYYWTEGGQQSARGYLRNQRRGIFN